MTIAFLADFDERRRQVRHYLAIVLTAERRVAGGKPSRAQERRLLTLRAGTFLIAYNLIEATTRGAVEAIHDKITTERVPFGALTAGLRKEVVRWFKESADPAANHTMNDLPSAFVAVALERRVKLSGNVDAKRIRELGDSYGFSCETSKDRTWGGSDLLTIKTKRNDLAHGVQTFEEVGRDYPARELVALTARSLRYMSEILESIASFLDCKGYRDPSGEAVDVTDNSAADSPS